MFKQVIKTLNILKYTISEKLKCPVGYKVDNLVFLLITELYIHIVSNLVPNKCK